jgi:hypothetical protein
MATNQFAKPLRTEEPLPPEAPQDPIEVELSDADMASESTAGTVITFGDTEEDLGPAPAFYDNLADHMDDTALRVLGAELVRKFDADKVSRADWEKTYTEGLELLGLKIMTTNDPWPGACAAFHPILTEAAVRFQAQAITEIWPSSGPCRTKIVGKPSPELDKRAARIEDDMNYCVTERMPEYRPELERLLFNLPLTGSAFKKIYVDPYLKRPVAMYVPAEDLVVGYGATDLASCERYTHVMKRTEGEVRRLQRSNFWRAVDLPAPSPVTGDKTEEKKDKIAGVVPSLDTDDRYTILEMYIDMDIPEFSEDSQYVPYVVTIDRGSHEVLSVRRNWEEGDPDFKRRQHMVAYHYIPGIGFYGLGLFHLIGGIAKATTAILRQLIDAGQLANLPGGLKTKGLRIKNEDTPIRPAEWRDVDVPGDDINKSLMPLPYKEPSKVLYDLMMNLVEEARRLASIPDINIGDMKQEAPVGTTLALLERAMKVMTGISARLHASLGQELKLLSRLNAETWPAYDFPIGEEGEQNPNLKQEDFDAGTIDVIPVSDPNAASMSQRVMQYTAMGQLMQQNPGIYDQPEFHRATAEVLGMRDVERIIPSARDQKPQDPVTENQHLLAGKPVKVFPEQDHEAHLKVHLAAIQDPKIIDLIGQSPAAPAIQGAAESHIREHMGFKYRNDIEKALGTQLPPYGETLPPEVEHQLSGLVAKAAEKVLAKDVAEKIQEQKLAEANDPLTEIQHRELDIKARDLLRKELEGLAREKAQAADQLTKTALDIARLEHDRKAATDKIEADLVKEVIKLKAGAEQKEKELSFQKGEADKDRAVQRIEGERDRSFQEKQGQEERSHKSEEGDKERTEAGIIKSTEIGLKAAQMVLSDRQADADREHQAEEAENSRRFEKESEDANRKHTSRESDNERSFKRRESDEDRKHQRVESDKDRRTSSQESDASRKHELKVAKAKPKPGSK